MSGGLGRPGSFLTAVYEHENEIRGTAEELRYHSHDSLEQITDDDLNMVGGIQVFHVDEEPESRHPGTTLISIVDKDMNIIGRERERRPVPLNNFNNIAIKYNIRTYVLKNLEGKIITGAFLYGANIPDIYLEDIEGAIKEFELTKKKKRTKKEINNMERLTEISKALSAKIILEKYNDIRIDRQYQCYLEYVEIKDDAVLVGVRGRGSTQEDAIEDYMSQIKGKLLVYNAMRSDRKEVFII
jgi:hypothetical protein